MAVRRGLSRFIDSMMDMYMKQQLASYQSNLVKQRQQELAQQQMLDRILTRVTSDPMLARRLSDAGLKSIGDIPISVFQQSPEMALSEASKGISSASNLASLPGSQLEMETSYAAQPGAVRGDPRVIEALDMMKRAKEQSLRASAPPISREFVNPAGIKTTTMVNPYEEMGRERPMERTAQQEGVREGEIATAAQPGKTSAAVSQFKALTPYEVQRSAQTAGASERARLGAYFDPQFIAARMKEYKDKAIAEAAAAGDRKRAEDIMTAQNNSTVGLSALQQMKDLYDKVKLGPGWANAMKASGRYLGGKTGALQVVNPDAAKLDRLAQGYSMLVYRTFGGTGQAVSDRDIQMMQAVMPFSYVLAEVGDQVFHDSATMLAFNPLIKARYGNQPFDLQIKVVQEWVKRARAAQKAGADQFEDPFAPGTYVPVIKD